MSLPRFEHVATIRPVELARPGVLTQALAPYVAVVHDSGEPVELTLTSGQDRLTVAYDGTGFSLTVTDATGTTQHRSRRSGRPDGPVDRVALTLTGTRLAVLGHEVGHEVGSGAGWVVRGVVDLRDRIDPHAEAWLADLRAEGGALQAFGQLGLRDVRLVTHADGSAYTRGGEVLLTATSAGPGFFDTAHTSVWSLDPATWALTHLSDVFFRRPDRTGVYGDHASHLLRVDDEDGERWLFATSTWGDFDHHRAGATVTATLAETDTDLLQGRHVLDTRPWHLPTDGLASVGVWDPHLVRTDEGWLAAYVSARKFFRFHPVVAAGPSLDALALRGAASHLKETEGPTLHRTGDEWVVLASDGVARRYLVLDLEAGVTGEVDAPYPSNIPWPTVVEHDGQTLMVGFDGEPVGGRLVGYGSHGALQVSRAVTPMH